MIPIFQLEESITNEGNIHMMKEQVAEAIIEDGKIKYIDKKLPPGEIRAKLIYSVEQDPHKMSYLDAIVRETSGIYRHVDPDKESSNLRSEWDRNIGE